MTYSLLSAHACALAHHLINRVVKPKDYTNMFLFYAGKISYARQNISALIITRLMKYHSLHLTIIPLGGAE